MKNPLCIIFLLYFGNSYFCNAQNVLDGVYIKNSTDTSALVIPEFILTGTVIDSITGHPIADATIELADKTCPSVFVKSDNKGHFSFQNIEICSETIYIHCSKAGYQMNSISHDYNQQTKKGELHTLFKLQKIK